MRSLSFMARGESRKRCRLFEFFNTMTKILGPKGLSCSVRLNVQNHEGCDTWICYHYSFLTTIAYIINVNIRLA